MRTPPKKPRVLLQDSVCLITGASGGIGEATARLLADSGARVILQGRNEEALDRIADEIGAVKIIADLTVSGATDLIYEEATRPWGRIDVLVNNAGIGWAGAFVDMPRERIESLFALNLLAPVNLTRAVLPGMLAAGRGSIVLVASIAGYLGVRDEAVYSATKGALLAFGESLRAETAGRGVAVSVVSPVVVDTPFFAGRGRPYTRSRPRPRSPEVVAQAICDAIREGRPETIVGSGMRLPIGLKAAFPRLYRRLADRFA